MEEDLLAADAAQLENRGHEELAEWWCVLNKWEWPDVLPEPEDVPPWNNGRHTPRRDALMNSIADIVPHKLRSYTWNKERMSVEEHDAWFAKTFGGKDE